METRLRGRLCKKMRDGTFSIGLSHSYALRYTAIHRRNAHVYRSARNTRGAFPRLLSPEQVPPYPEMLASSHDHGPPPRSRRRLAGANFFIYFEDARPRSIRGGRPRFW